MNSYLRPSDIPKHLLRDTTFVSLAHAESISGHTVRLTLTTHMALDIRRQIGVAIDVDRFDGAIGVAEFSRDRPLEVIVSFPELGTIAVGCSRAHLLERE